MACGIGKVGHKVCGGHSTGETPSNIPNLEAKPGNANGTAIDRSWESRTPPQHNHTKTTRPPPPPPSQETRVGGTRIPTHPHHTRTHPQGTHPQGTHNHTTSGRTQHNTTPARAHNHTTRTSGRTHARERAHRAHTQPHSEPPTPTNQIRATTLKKLSVVRGPVF